MFTEPPNEGQFSDRYFRFTFMSQAVRSGQIPPISVRKDFMIVEEKFQSGDILKASLTSACVGDDKVDISRFCEGLDYVPSQLGADASFNDRIQTRLQEWAISGMCVRCQVSFMESQQ